MSEVESHTGGDGIVVESLFVDVQMMSDGIL